SVTDMFACRGMGGFGPSTASRYSVPDPVITASHVAPLPEVVIRPRLRNAAAEMRWKSSFITPSGQPSLIQRRSSICFSLSLFRCAAVIPLRLSLHWRVPPCPQEGASAAQVGVAPHAFTLLRRSSTYRSEQRLGTEVTPRNCSIAATRGATSGCFFETYSR